MATIDQEIAKVGRDIDKVESEIDKIQEAIDQAASKYEAAFTDRDKEYWRNKEAQLRDEKARLRDEKAQLRHKEAQLRDEKARLQVQTVPTAPSAFADESSKLERVVALLKKLVLGQSRLEQGLHASLWLTFWGEIASTVTSETTVQFRKTLVDYYGDAEDKSNMCDERQPLRCMVTDLRLPGKWITAAHLLGRKHSTKAHVFGFHDIDDPRNGFLWNRAMEEAYSLFQIVFSWDAAANSFRIHVLDKALTGQKISGIKLRKPFNRSLDHYIDAQTKQQFDEMTFDDLQGKLVRFNNLNRPFKRVLCLHAKLGIRKAKEEKYLPSGLELGQYNFDYWTETTDSILLQTFLEDSQPWIKESDLEGLSSASADTP